MKISDLINCPTWLASADTKNADIEIINDVVFWNGGTWYEGLWLTGEWRGGEWRGGVWHGGIWGGTENRLLFMASLAGIWIENGICTAYRTTQSDGHGRWTKSFIQPEGEFFETSVAPPGSGTCKPGIHVTGAAKAWTYFKIDKTCQFWKCTFKLADLLDCDGEKARIRGGTFVKVERPF